MSDEISTITNRPEELRQLPHYNSLANMPIAIDIAGSIGDFLTYDLADLDGVQPVEARHLDLNEGLIHVNPTEKSLAIYHDEKVRFQLISVVINAHSFEERDGIIHASPYSISLRPATKRGEVSEVDSSWLKAIDLEQIDHEPKYYFGFNPFQNAYGFYAIGLKPSDAGVESDMVGFIWKTYALATTFDNRNLASPGIPSISDHIQARRDYEKYRIDWYFKKFTKNKTRKIWGCDSPIELFLLQAMKNIGLKPDLQSMICEDQLVVPSFHKLWENHKSRRRMKMITEADFYFPESKLAVFCDSKQHHSSPETIKKDAAISEKLASIGINSLRIPGVDIAKSPFECAERVKNALS